MKEAKWIDELRLKASWGQSERVPAASFVTGTFAYEDAYMDRPSIKPNQMQLDNLRPEIVSSYNLGLEGAFKRNMIRFSFDYYDKKTSDLIMENMSIQSTTGYSSVRRYNGGDIRNRGWEFSVSLNDIVKIGAFRLGLSNINLSRNVNEITSLPESMIAEINAAAGRQIPVGEMAYVIYNNLAKYYDVAYKALEEVTGKKYETLNIIGGGSKNGFLNELTAKYTGKKIITGPAEGTAIGNLMMQMIGCGDIKDVAEGRRIIKASFDIEEL